MIDNAYTKTVQIQRLTPGSGQTENYAPHIANLPCAIQPLDDSYSQDIDGNSGKEWLMICAVSDIVEGDRVIDGADQYRVAATEAFEFLGAPHHMELRIRKSLL